MNQRRNPNSPRADRKGRDVPAAAPAEAAAPAVPKPPRKSVEGWFAVAGAVICVVLNVTTDGRVPGGYAAGVIGGGLGWVVGLGAEKILQKIEQGRMG